MSDKKKIKPRDVAFVEEIIKSSVVDMMSKKCPFLNGETCIGENCIHFENGYIGYTAFGFRYKPYVVSPRCKLWTSK